MKMEPLSLREKVSIIVGAVAANGAVSPWAVDELMELMPNYQLAEGSCIVTTEDADNYCRILSLLGMEEEGDPVARTEQLLIDALEADRAGRVDEARPPREWVEAAYAAFLRINDDDSDKAKTDLGTWAIGTHAAIQAAIGGQHD